MRDGGESLFPDRLILVRHGETAWNKEGRYLGQANPGLNKNGELQARAAAYHLRGERIDRIYSSDLRRATETARLIAVDHDIPVSVTSLWREINFGIWEGLTFDEIQNNYSELFNEWLIDPLRVRIPEGETTEEVRSRIVEAWNSIARTAGDEEAVVIVAHGGPLRLLWCYLTGTDFSRQWDFHMGHGEIVELVRNGDVYSLIQK